MISVSIFYPNTETCQFNLDYYVTQHLPLIDRLLKPMGLQKVVVEQGIGTPMPSEPAPYLIVAHLLFNNLEEMEMGMGHCTDSLMADVPNFYNAQPIVQISRQL